MKQEKELIKSLIEFQRENTSLPLVNKDCDIAYCDMHTMADTITPLLAKHNLSIFYFFEELPDSRFVKVRVYHKSGQMLESAFPIVNFNNVDDLNHYVRMAIGNLLCLVDTDLI